MTMMKGEKKEKNCHVDRVYKDAKHSQKEKGHKKESRPPKNSLADKQTIERRQLISPNMRARS